MSLSFKIFFLFSLIFADLSQVFAQDDDVYMIKKIHDEALSNGRAYPWLTDLCNKHGGRIAGSPAYLGAANFTKDALSTIKGVQSYHQDCEANYWKRGAKEQVKIIGKNGKNIRFFQIPFFYVQNSRF